MRGQVQDISKRLSERFQQLLPLNPGKHQGRKRPSESEIAANSAAALQRFYEAAHDERIRHGLGIIARARVAIGLQHRLIQAGYPPPLVKQMLFAMLTAAFISKQP